MGMCDDKKKKLFKSTSHELKKKENVKNIFIISSRFKCTGQLICRYTTFDTPKIIHFVYVFVHQLYYIRMYIYSKKRVIWGNTCYLITVIIINIS